MNESLEDAPPPSQVVPDLNPWLGYGALAALAAGLLVSGSAILSLAGWQQGVLSLSEFLNLAALLTLGVVLVAYWHVSLRTQTLGLRKSGLGLFGILIIIELASLTTTEGGLHWWNILIWIVLAVVTLLFLLVVYGLEEVEKEAADQKPAIAPEEKPDAEVAAPVPGTDAETSPTGQDGKKTWGKSAKTIGVILGGFGALGLLVLRLILRLVGKMVGKQVLQFMDADLIEGLLFLALVLVAVVFLVWFAVVKIRLRNVLGTLAAVVGSVELLVILLGALALGGMLLDVFQVVEQAGLDEKAMEAGFEALGATWARRIDVGTIVFSVLWAVMTAGLFLKCRSRLASNPN